MNNYAKACVNLGQMQAHIEAMESLPYRALTEEQLDQYLTTARALLRSANYLVEALSSVEVV